MSRFSKEKNQTAEDRSPTFIENNYLVECPLHKNNYLANICLAEGCVEPLCPECVSIHIDLHNELRNNAKIDTLANKRQETIKSLNDILMQFHEEKRKLLKHSDQARNEIAQHYYNKISKAKAKIIQIVEGYFDTLNNDVRKDMDEHYAKHPGEFKHLNLRLDNIIGTLEKQLQNLKTHNYIKPMLKFQNANLHHDYQTLKEQINDAIEVYTADIKKVEVDESKLYALNVELSKYIQLKGGDIKEKPEFGDMGEKHSIVEKAFAINDITNEMQNYSRFSNNLYDVSPQKYHHTTNMSNYNFSESKIREGSKGNRDEIQKDKLTQNFSFYFPRSVHNFK